MQNSGDVKRLSVYKKFHTYFLPAYCGKSFLGNPSPDTPIFWVIHLQPHVFWVLHWVLKFEITKNVHISPPPFLGHPSPQPPPPILMIPSKEHFLKIQVILQSKYLAKELVNKQVAFQWQTIIASVLIHNEFLQILILVIKNGQSKIWDWSATSAALLIGQRLYYNSTTFQISEPVASFINRLVLLRISKMSNY
jgi:hypothetical protein